MQIERESSFSNSNSLGVCEICWATQKLRQLRVSWDLKIIIFSHWFAPFGFFFLSMTNPLNSSLTEIQGKYHKLTWIWELSILSKCRLDVEHYHISHKYTNWPNAPWAFAAVLRVPQPQQNQTQENTQEFYASRMHIAWQHKQAQQHVNSVFSNWKTAVWPPPATW